MILQKWNSNKKWSKIGWIDKNEKGLAWIPLPPSKNQMKKSKVSSNTKIKLRKQLKGIHESKDPPRKEKRKVVMYKQVVQSNDRT